MKRHESLGQASRQYHIVRVSTALRPHCHPTFPITKLCVPSWKAWRNTCVEATELPTMSGLHDEL